ncbi:hypothetical protein AHIS2_p003 [Acaryochloris phage A-HIS2]|nr:hypothetical protein AHIS2_p003 [Acaryochloris phage A-HIS2]
MITQLTTDQQKQILVHFGFDTELNLDTVDSMGSADVDEAIGTVAGLMVDYETASDDEFLAVCDSVQRYVENVMGIEV